MRSARCSGGVAASCVLLAAALSGCTTTQQTAARQAIHADRTLEANKPIKVSEVDRDLRVEKVAVLSDSGGVAIAVTMRNTGQEPVNDLPLAVGVRTADGRRTYLNTGGHVPYFQSHAPALAPGAVTTWVFESTDKAVAKEVASARSAFAKVGTASHPPTVANGVPKLNVTGVSTRDGDASVHATVQNPTAIPQYGLAVYAWATRHGRYVAAGRTSVDDLSDGHGQTVNVKLIGDSKGATMHVAAPPTIFQ